MMPRLLSTISKTCCYALLIAGVAACSTVKDWTGGGDDDKRSLDKASGPARYEVLPTRPVIDTDSSLQDLDVQWLDARENLSWPQRGAEAGNAIGSMMVTGFDEKETATIGEGEAWSSVLVSEPVIAGGVIYVMDAKGYVSAHDAKDIDKVLWVSTEAAVDEEEEMLGGGLAVAGEQLFVTTGHGEVLALSVQNGNAIWRRSLAIPLRAAPKLQLGIVYVMTADDQIFALDSASGDIKWQHRGIGERVSFLSAISPAIGDNLLVAAYSSGELYGLAADSGQEIWNDSLATARKTSATSVFTGFGGDPVMAGGVAFASSSNGMTAATHLLTGRRLWEQEVSGTDRPWLSANFLFVLTPEAQVVAMHGRDGRVKWTYTLPRYEDEEDREGALRWHGPVGFNDQLAILGEHGEMVLLSPNDGKLIRTVDIPDEVRTSPVVAGGTLYLVTADAKLHALR